ncbi:MAG: two-component regulator propeller domain-containing protein [Ignavibacteriaceae bacterium]|nr:two-component regulator propeller domain-containing protein [Ignavibacteriaceae bacterium]
MLYKTEPSDHFTHYKHDPKNLSNSLSNNIITSICEDENGILWIGTTGPST